MTDGNKTKKDLTRIEDLGEFLHQESDDDLGLDSFSEEATESLDSLPDLPPEELPQDEFSSTENEENNHSIEESTETVSEDSHELSSPPELPVDDEDENDPFSNQADEAIQEPNAEADPFASEEATPSLDEESLESDPFSTSDQAESQLSSEHTTSNSSIDDGPSLDLVSEENNQFGEIEAPTQIVDTAEHEALPSEDVEEKPQNPSENFEELREFAKNISYGDVHSPGNPPYSLLLFNINPNDKDGIIDVLLETETIKNDEIPQYVERIDRGSLLIPRINEYVAIFLVHKLRSFDLTFEVGPSDLIHPPAYFDQHEDKGVVSKQQLQQNKNQNLNFNKTTDSAFNFVITSLPKLDGWTVLHYRGIVNHQLILELNQEKIDQLKMGSDNNISQEFPQIYQELKNQALKLGANAIIGLQHSLAPIQSSEGVSYQILFTGDATYIERTTPL